MEAKTFLEQTPENGDLNQYWYSAHTIDALCSEIERVGRRVACLSTPSLYFALKERNGLDRFERLVVFDLDTQWKDQEGDRFVKWDFNDPEAVGGSGYEHAFDLVVVDPPFITEEVWRKYARGVAKLLLCTRDGAQQGMGQADGHVLCTTIAENASLMHELFGAKPSRFQPSIPHLVYQYETYANYDAELLGERNTELPE